MCLVRQSCLRLFAAPWTAAHQAPLSMGFSRQEYWSGLQFPSPGDLPDPGLEPSCNCKRVLYHLSHQGSSTDKDGGVEFSGNASCQGDSSQAQQLTAKILQRTFQILQLKQTVEIINIFMFIIKYIFMQYIYLYYINFFLYYLRNTPCEMVTNQKTSQMLCHIRVWCISN